MRLMVEERRFTFLKGSKTNGRNWNRQGWNGELGKSPVKDIKKRKFLTVGGFQQCQTQLRNQIVKRHRGGLWISHQQVRGNILKEKILEESWRWHTYFRPWKNKWWQGSEESEQNFHCLLVNSHNKSQQFYSLDECLHFSWIQLFILQNEQELSSMLASRAPKVVIIVIINSNNSNNSYYLFIANHVLGIVLGSFYVLSNI